MDLGIGMIGKSLPHMVHVVIRLFEESGNVGIIHLVVDHVPITLRFDQASIS
jgi:hypothetical protein